MAKLKIALATLLLFTLIFFGGTLWAADGSASADTRILIDISGSMKKNDPKNLRRPAVRLLVGLLPENSRAGVWTFGKYVNMQVPLGMVDKRWKERARDGASKIASPGQFTNIEEAIKRSIGDWKGPDDRYRRHVVLLTDGMVDVSKNPKESAASRQRILDELLPKLKQAEAKVHTIALSARADHELMKALAGETGGWYEQVDNAEQLQRIFLRIFEKVGRPDTLPLKDNKFQVDASIEEVTLLIFRQAEAAPTQVIMPSGKTFNAESAPAGVSWHRDQGYDLLTIAQPEVGEWRVQAAVDPDNRVVVVTNLKMEATELPSRVVAGEQTPLVVHFTNGGKQITRKAFLDVVNLKGEHIDSNGPGEPRPIYDDGQNVDQQAGDGLFSLDVGENLAQGKVELIISAQGTTFQREQRQLFEVVDPVLVETTPQEQGGTAGLSVRVTPDESVLVLDSFSLEATLVSLEGQEEGVIFLPGADGVSYEAWIDPGQLQQGSWNLGGRVTAKTVAGNDLVYDLDPIAIEGTKEIVVEPAEPVPEPEPVAEEPAEEESEYGVKEYATIFGVGNVVLLLIGGLVFWFWRRRRADKREVELIEEEEEALHGVNAEPESSPAASTAKPELEKTVAVDSSSAKPEVSANEEAELNQADTSDAGEDFTADDEPNSIELDGLEEVEK
ncbi:MAG: VWA domain-containing protein [Chromatiales bacterium]|nr:VWA domain-containing protein [Chromatiales bacterium]